MVPCQRRASIRDRRRLTRAWPGFADGLSHRSSKGAEAKYFTFTRFASRPTGTRRQCRLPRRAILEPVTSLHLNLNSWMHGGPAFDPALDLRAPHPTRRSIRSIDCLSMIFANRLRGRVGGWGASEVSGRLRIGDRELEPQSRPIAPRAQSWQLWCHLCRRNLTPRDPVIADAPLHP